MSHVRSRAEELLSACRTHGQRFLAYRRGSLRRQALVGVALAPVFAASLLAAFWARYENEFGASAWGAFRQLLPYALAAKVACFAAAGLLRGWNRFVAFQDVLAICKAAALASLTIAALKYGLLQGVGVPRTVFVLDFLFTVTAIGGLRSVARILTERQSLGLGGAGRIATIIVGANDSGEALLRAIRRDPRSPYRVVGFTTENRSLLRTSISAVPVLGPVEKTCQIAARLDVREALIAAGELPGKQVRELIEEGARCGVSLKVMPSWGQMLSGQLHLQPRKVEIDDLLRREPVQLDQTALRGWLAGRTVLVTGSAGSIGSELCRQLLAFAPAKMVLVDRSETGQFFLERELASRAGDVRIEVALADLNDRRRMRAVFDEHAPDVVLHAAAYKHVPLMERHPGEALKNIVFATQGVADLAEEHGVDSFVMISTDKAVNPTNVMGCCKRVAELYVQSLASASTTRFVTVRFGNVLDSAGSVVPIFRDQIAAGGPITVTHPDIVRYFMTIPEASQLVLQAGAMGRGGEIFVLDMGEPVRIVELARDMIRLSGLVVGEDIEIEFSGLRPGEKLYEELLIEGERHLPTTHAKILVAEGALADEATLQRIEQLRLLADASRAEVVEALNRIVPQYAPSDLVLKRAAFRQAA
ncbi:MAG TPA: nucleoside-diphosphate sugar epimerase/dehydratase [Pirellulaceae bacterium]|nr:nucleoside-diphosphate sugar epimerase/dehydratase [Pirellulaceae bacterium]